MKSLRFDEVKILRVFLAGSFAGVQVEWSMRRRRREVFVVQFFWLGRCIGAIKCVKIRSLED